MAHRRKWLPLVLIITGTIGALLGILLAAAYVWEAYLSRIGEADQSLLFWYLPILFLGLIVAGGGLSLIAVGVKSLKDE